MSGGCCGMGDCGGACPAPVWPDGLTVPVWPDGLTVPWDALQVSTFTRREGATVVWCEPEYRHGGFQTWEFFKRLLPGDQRARLAARLIKHRVETC